MSSDKPKLKMLVAVPTMGSVHPMLTTRLIKWGREYKGDEINYYFTFKVAPVDRARNQIVEFFLRGDYTHLVMIDSDTIPPEDALKRMLAADKPVVSGLTGILRIGDDGEWEVYDNCFLEREIEPETGRVTKTFLAQQHTGLQKLFRCGAACLMIKREVLETLAKPCFKFVLNEAGTGHIVSEDIYFCDRLREAGIELWAETDVICQHHKDIMI